MYQHSSPFNLIFENCAEEFGQCLRFTHSFNKFIQSCHYLELESVYVMPSQVLKSLFMAIKATYNNNQEISSKVSFSP